MTVRRRHRRLRRSALPAALALALLLAPAAAAKTFVANKRGDHAPDGCTKKDCTLREAVIRANKHDGPDRVELPSQKPYRLKIADNPMQASELSGDLNVDEALTIIHPGAGRATINAKGTDRIVENEARLNLRKLVLRGGIAKSPPGVLSGGAILARSNLKVIASRIVGNRAATGGGVATGGPADVTVRRSTVANNEAPVNGGGGIYFAGDELKVVASTVAHNLAGCKVGICQAVDPHGGGLRVAMPAAIYAEAEIKRSTFVGNEAFKDGGGIHNEDQLRIVNSTITQNRATRFGGGLFGEADSLAKLNAVTIARNRADSNNAGTPPGSGGGIWAQGGDDVVEVRNSLIARNRATGGAIQECDHAAIGILSLGGNLITSVSGGCDMFTDPQDIVDLGPRIGALDDYGGPTKTIKLKAGSPAINEADGPNPPGRDQRGVQRQDADIGAFERQ